MPFAGNLRTLPLPAVFQTLNNIKATGVLRLRSNAGSRDVVFNQGEIVGVGFLDKEAREELDLRLSLLGVEDRDAKRLEGVTWYWTAMRARVQTSRAELIELVHDQAREQLHNLFAWSTADFAFDEAGPGKAVANALVACSLERPLSIDTATILLEAAKQQDEWAELRARIRDETGAAAMGSSPALAQVAVDAGEVPVEPEDGTFHLYLDGEWRGPYARQQIIGLVQTGEVAPETWSYDPLTQERKTLDQLLGGEARRITPDELESLRQAVKAAEGRLSEERAGRSADLAELRGLASEILRLAHDCQLADPAISVVIERLAEVVGGEDPSIVALAGETVIVAVVRRLRDLGERELSEARARADQLARRIVEADTERIALETQLAEAERRSDAERDSASSLRERLAAAAEDASRLNQELERTHRDSTARISAPRTPEASKEPASRPAELERELGRMRAEHARLHNEVAVLQARLDEDRARHEAELEASRALASSLGQRQDPPTETIGKATEKHHATDSGLAAEVERLRALLVQAESRGGGAQLNLDDRRRIAAEHGDTERLRKDLHQARAEAARNAELVRAAEQSETRVAAAEARAAGADKRNAQAEDELAAARVALGRAEDSRREQERSAYEAARQHTQLQVHLRELTARLEDGEARLGELNGLAEQLAAARSHAAELEAEAVRLRADLAVIRDSATGKLDRAKRRVGELRARLREAKRDRNAMVPWSSPATATYSAVPGQQQVPWPSPATASFGPGQQPWQPDAALSPHGAPEPASGATMRTTSGTFVPMPMPEGSSAQRQRVQLPSVAQQPRTPAPRANLIRGPWAIAAAAGVLAVLGLWWGATSAVPVCERAQVNGETKTVNAGIPGRLEGILFSPNSWVRQGDRLAVVRNTDLDNIKKQGFQLSKTQLEGRVVATEAAMQRAKAEHDKLVAELAQPPEVPAVPAVGADPRLRLRDEFAVRLVEYRGDLDELRLRIAGVETDLAAEERRLLDLREKELTAPCDGMVLSIKEAGASLMQGEVAITLVDASTLVIDAEFPGSTPPDRGTSASVYLGNLRVEAKVLARDEVRVGRLAQSPNLAVGHSRVLLMPSNRLALTEVYSQQARIAFTNGNPGILGSFGLWMRGF